MLYGCFKNSARKIISAFAIIISSAPAIALAPLSGAAQSIGTGEGGFLDPLAGRSGYETNETIANDAFVETLAGEIISYALGLIGLIFLALMIYSGFQWMTAGGNEEKVESAKKRITQAAIGLALVMLSYLIVYWVINFFYTQPGVTNLN